jgi:hypothetical protein
VFFGIALLAVLEGIVFGLVELIVYGMHISFSVFADEHSVRICDESVNFCKIISKFDLFEKGASDFLEKVKSVAICQAVIGRVVFSVGLLNQKRPQFDHLSFSFHFKEGWLHIFRLVPLTCFEGVIDDDGDVVIEDDVLPDVGLGLMNFESIDALGIYLLGFEYFLEEVGF